LTLVGDGLRQRWIVPVDTPRNPHWSANGASASSANTVFPRCRAPYCRGAQSVSEASGGR